MSSSVSTTSYALLGLLVFDSETSEHGLTGYELKQRADRTLRFYWVSPAMSQIYTELDRLSRNGFVEAVDDTSGKRTTRRFLITPDGRVESNGNFHGAPVAYVLDFLSIAVADLASISERRTDRFLDVTRSQGLPPFPQLPAGFTHATHGPG